MTLQDLASKLNLPKRGVVCASVILAIFLALAVFGLPLLWKSPRFAVWHKVVISIVTVLYTAVILWATYYLVFVILIPHFRQVGTVLNSI